MKGIHLHFDNIRNYLFKANENPILGLTLDLYIANFERVTFQMLNLVKIIVENQDESEMLTRSFAHTLAELHRFVRTKPVSEEDIDYGETHRALDFGQDSLADLLQCKQIDNERGDMQHMLSVAEDKQRDIEDLLSNIPKMQIHSFNKHASVKSALQPLLFTGHPSTQTQTEITLSTVGFLVYSPRIDGSIEFPVDPQVSAPYSTDCGTSMEDEPEQENAIVKQQIVPADTIDNEGECIQTEIERMKHSRKSKTLKIKKQSAQLSAFGKAELSSLRGNDQSKLGKRLSKKINTGPPKSLKEEEYPHIATQLTQKVKLKKISSRNSSEQSADQSLSEIKERDNKLVPYNSVAEVKKSAKDQEKQQQTLFIHNPLSSANASIDLQNNENQSFASVSIHEKGPAFFDKFSSINEGNRETNLQAQSTVQGKSQLQDEKYRNEMEDSGCQFEGSRVTRSIKAIDFAERLSKTVLMSQKKEELASLTLLEESLKGGYSESMEGGLLNLPQVRGKQNSDLTEMGLEEKDPNRQASRQSFFLKLPSISQDHRLPDQAITDKQAEQELLTLKSQKDIRRVIKYIQMLETSHLRQCGSNCIHLAKFYDFLKRSQVGNKSRVQLSLHKKNIFMREQ